MDSRMAAINCAPQPTACLHLISNDMTLRNQPQHTAGHHGNPEHQSGIKLQTECVKESSLRLLVSDMIQTFFSCHSGLREGVNLNILRDYQLFRPLFKGSDRLSYWGTRTDFCV